MSDRDAPSKRMAADGGLVTGGAIHRFNAIV
jgi:hypothetical protein